MTNNIKYTSDGKKVVIIGDLNQTEKIVQEIFVTEDGCEIPQGERFVCKNLLDSPLKSWKEKTLENLEKRYESDKKEWEIKIKALKDENGKAYRSLESKVKWLNDISKQPFEEDIKKIINTLTLFLSDKKKYVVLDKRIIEINTDYNDLLEDYDDYYGKYEGMKLITLYGNTNGSLQWNVHRYSDGSGSKSKIDFFDNYEDAVKLVSKRVNVQKEINGDDIKLAQKYGFQINHDLLERYKQYQRVSYENEINMLEKRRKEIEEKYNTVNNKMQPKSKIETLWKNI